MSRIFQFFCTEIQGKAAKSFHFESHLHSNSFFFCLDKFIQMHALAHTHTHTHTHMHTHTHKHTKHTQPINGMGEGKPSLCFKKNFQGCIWLPNSNWMWTRDYNTVFTDIRKKRKVKLKGLCLGIQF